MLIVADSSALVALATCEALDILLQVYEDVFVPQAVYDEVVQPGKYHASTLDAFLAARVMQVDMDQLKEALKQEGPGILNWALAGLDRLRKRGYFVIPKAVEQATQEFQMSNDTAAYFVAEKCVVGPDKEIQSRPLFEAYSAWCLQCGHKPNSSTALANDWKRLGFKRKRQASGTVWQGVSLKLNSQ